MKNDAMTDPLFATYEDFMYEKTRPIAISVTILAAVFLFSYSIVDYATYGMSPVFSRVFWLRIQAPLSAIPFLVALLSKRYHRGRFRAGLILILLGLLVLTYAYIFVDTRIEIIQYSYMYYVVASLSITPFLPVAEFIAMYGVAICATLIMMMVRGLHLSDYLTVGVFALSWFSLSVFSLQKIRRMTIELYEVTRKYHQQASIDALSRLLSRRTWYERSAQELHSSVESGNPVSCIMIDIDRFKTINDTWGHQCGDTAIIAMARAVLSALRSRDIAGRLGGEEFAILLPATAISDALLVAERVRANVEALSVPCAGKILSLSISVGVSSNEGSVDRLVSQADKNLYIAKREGRNRVYHPLLS